VYSQLASNDITSADIIKGISLCSDTNPITDGTSARNPKNGFAAIGSPSESGTRYCWCKGIERKNYNDNNFQSMAVNYWTATGTSPSNCERDCAESCVYWLRWADGWWDNDGFYNKILGNF